MEERERSTSVPPGERTKLGFRVGEAITRHAVVAAGADVVIVVHVALMLDCCFRIEDLTTE